jgi:nucleoside-diphosphate-sugar epimerase
LTAFVTGATGGLGRNLCRRLVRSGIDCTGTGRDEVAGNWLRDAGVRFRKIDVADTGAMAAAMAGHEVVFHCAALSAVWGPAKAFAAANVAGTSNVLAAARQAGIRRVVFVSTPSIYFDFRNRRAIRESDPLPARPANGYVASKRAAENLVRAAAADGQDCVILRPRGIIGPWDRALAPRLARVARRGWIPVPNRAAHIDVTCVENVVDALLAAAEAKPEISGRAYNISNGSPVTVGELLHDVLRAMGIVARLVSIPARPAIVGAALLEMAARCAGGREPPVTAYSLALLAYDQTLDIGAARRDLGWEPRQSLADGIAATGAWWEAQHGDG